MLCSEIQSILGVLQRDPAGRCFAMGSDLSLLFSGEIRPPVAVSNKFLTSVEVLGNFLVISMGLCIVYFKLLWLEGECWSKFLYVFFVCLFFPSRIYMIYMIQLEGEY